MKKLRKEKSKDFRKNYKLNSLNNYMFNKKGLSDIIVILILIALVIVSIAIIWVVISKLINTSLEETSSCSEVFNKVEINELYTCYDSGTFKFSINIQDLNVDKVVVSVAGNGVTKNYTLTNEAQAIPGLGQSPSGYGDVKLPEKNSGLTYISSDFSSIPDSIKISPVIGRNQCGVTDSLTKINDCFSVSAGISGDSCLIDGDCSSGECSGGVCVSGDVGSGDWFLDNFEFV